MRTLLTLDIAGLIERYSGVFDLHIYRQKKDDYIGSVIRYTDPRLIGRAQKIADPLQLEIVEFAKKQNYHFPTRAYIYAWLRYFSTQLKRIVRFPFRIISKIFS